MNKALNIFDAMDEHERGVVAVCSMMKCLIKHQQYERAFDLFRANEVSESDRTGSDILHIAYLKLCAETQRYDHGAQFIQQRLLPNLRELTIDLINCIIDFYGKSGDLQKTGKIFSGTAEAKKDTVTVNSMMTCYIKHHQSKHAMETFEAYNAQIQISDRTKVLYLKACSNVCDFAAGLEMNQMIKEYIIDTSNLEPYSSELHNTLIDFYGNCGDIDTALHIFEHIKDETYNVVTINAMMNAFSVNNKSEDTMRLFHDIRANNRRFFELEAYCYSIVLNCCGQTGAMQEGSQIIRELETLRENAHILPKPQVQAATLNMYAKCGEFEKAIAVFNRFEANNRCLQRDENGALLMFTAGRS